jgi:hypothetical protein
MKNCRIIKVSIGIFACLLTFPALAQSSLDVPVMAGGNVVDGVAMGGPCLTTGEVKVTTYLPVKSGPGDKFREIDRLKNGQPVSICNNEKGSPGPPDVPYEESNVWFPVVYIPGRSAYAEDRCWSSKNWATEHEYTGPCRRGWIRAKYVINLAE